MGNYPSCNVAYDDFADIEAPDGSGVIRLSCGQTQIFTSPGCVTTVTLRCKQQCVSGLCCYDVSQLAFIADSGTYQIGFCFDDRTDPNVCGLPHWITAYSALGLSDPRCKP